MPPLTNTRHELFVSALFTGCTQKEAAIRAGYSPKRADRTGHELVRKSEIMARLDELKVSRSTDLIGSVDERKTKLSEIYRSPIQGGREARIKAGHVIAAIAEQNRMEGIGSQGTDVNVFVPIQFERAERRDYQDED